MSDNTRSRDESAGHPVPHGEESDAEAPSVLLSPGGTPWGTLSARVISVVSRKGGVGKTTSVINLGAAFAISGHSVLLIGIDPQCGISHSLGHGKYDLDSGLLDVFQAHIPLNHLAYPTTVEGLRFVTPNIWTLEEEDEYKRLMERESDTFLRAVDRARDLYDTILIDCPPGLGPETRAALLASDSYLVPVQAEELCRDSLERLLAFVQAFRDQTFAEANLAEGDAAAAPPVLEGLFLTMVNARTRVSRHVAEEVAAAHGLDLYATVVPRTTRLAEMALRGRPAVIYDRRSAGSRAYFDLMDEVIARHAARRGRPSRADSPEPAERAGALPGNGGRSTILTDLASLTRLAALTQPVPARPRGPETAFPGDEGEARVLDGLLDEAEPELLSLDELLAEEEGLAPGGDDDWEEPRWGGGDEYGNRLN